MCVCIDKILLQHLVEIKAQVRLNTELLKKQAQLLQELRSSSADVTTTATKFPKLPAGTALPLQTFLQVEKLEQILQTQPAEKRKLVAFILATLGDAADAQEKKKSLVIITVSQRQAVKLGS